MSLLPPTLRSFTPTLLARTAAPSCRPRKRLRTMHTAAGDQRELMRRVAQPVAVATATLSDDKHERFPNHGATLSSFTSISLNPPMIAFSLRLPSRLADHLAKATDRPFTVYLLAENQAEVAQGFARQGQLPSDQLPFPPSLFTDLSAGALGSLQCQIVQSTALHDASGRAGEEPTSMLFIARVREARHTTRRPLLWHNRRYCNLGTPIDSP